MDCIQYDWAALTSKPSEAAPQTCSSFSVNTPQKKNFILTIRIFWCFLMAHCHISHYVFTLRLVVTNIVSYRPCSLTST